MNCPKLAIACAAIALIIALIELFLTLSGKIPTVEDHCLWVGITMIWILTFGCYVVEDHFIHPR